MLGRTLDWGMPLLRDLTLELSVVRDGALLYRATTFAGFLGIFTASRPGAYAVAVNFRCADDGAEEEEEEEEQQEDEAFNWPIGVVVRHTLESCSSYSAALVHLEREPLMSQTYFILAGVEPGQACVLTRGLRNSIRPVHLAPHGVEAAVTAVSQHAHETQKQAAQIQQQKGRPRGIGKGGASSNASESAQPNSSNAPVLRSYLLQANLDHWIRARSRDFQESLPRTRLVEQCFAARVSASSVGASVVSEDEMWRLLCVDPIWDEQTIYATVCVPAIDHYVNRLQPPVPVTSVKKQATTSRGRASGGKKRR